MSLLEEPEAPASGGGGRWLLLLVLLVAAGGGIYYVMLPSGPAPESETGSRAPTAAPPPPPTATAAPPPAAPDVPDEPDPEPDPAPEVEAEAPAPPPPAPVVLRVTSDVPGADVFIDRDFVGTTPFESRDLAPGSYRVNVSATGYEGHASDVVVGEELVELDVAFQAVRLDLRIPVVHKHRFGDCRGELVANLDGIHYRTEDDDRFSVPLDGMEEFAVDYLEHNLRLRVRDGRTYNFTDETDNADALFVFHRDVERARERLAAGDDD